MLLLLLTPSLLVAAVSCFAKFHVHDATFSPDAILRVTRGNMTLGGGVERYTTMVNGSVPGPALCFHENQVRWVRVYNDLVDANLTMHWHGIAQSAYPFSDGTPLASQWPIPPLHFFDYELSFPNGSAGTYFYHSHVGFQATTAAGGLIVKERGEEPYKVDGERLVLLQELFNITDEAALSRLQSVPFSWTGENDGWLINGKGMSNQTGLGGGSWEVIDVEPSKTYRLRFVGGNTLTQAILAFEDHDELRVIEADAGYTKPHATNLLQIGSGQRFSTLLETKSCAQLEAANRTDFYMMVQSRQRPTQSTAYAILRYNSSACSQPQAALLSTSSYPTRPPMVLPPTSYSFLDYALAPLHPDDDNFPTASEVTRTVYIDAQQIVNPNEGIEWSDDKMAWTEDNDNPNPHTTPSVPYLVSLYNDGDKYLPNLDAAIANGGLDPKTHTFPAAIGEVIEVVIQQLGSTAGGKLDTHPWHAHGVHYWDIGSGPGPYNRTANELRLQGTHPVRRDTTMLYPFEANTTTGAVGGWRAWRMRVTDPGVWMVHCHILQHMIMGMQTVWVHGNASEVLKVSRLDVQGYLEFGGNVYGNGTHDPKVVHFSEL